MPSVCPVCVCVHVCGPVCVRAQCVCPVCACVRVVYLCMCVRACVCVLCMCMCMSSEYVSSECVSNVCVQCVSVRVVCACVFVRQKLKDPKDLYIFLQTKHMLSKGAQTTTDAIEAQRTTPLSCLPPGGAVLRDGGAPPRWRHRGELRRGPRPDPASAAPTSRVGNRHRHEVSHRLPDRDRWVYPTHGYATL